MAVDGRRVTREDLEAAFSRVVGEGKEAAQSSAPQGLVVAGAVALGVIALSYLAGRRRGRKRSAVLEIRRV